MQNDKGFHLTLKHGTVVPRAADSRVWAALSEHPPAKVEDGVIPFALVDEHGSGFAQLAVNDKGYWRVLSFSPLQLALLYQALGKVPSIAKQVPPAWEALTPEARAGWPGPPHVPFTEASLRTTAG